jgi:hypothetical protein
VAPSFIDGRAEVRDEEEIRDDVPPEPADETWQMGDPSEEGQEGAEQDSGFEERGGQGG